MKTLSSHELAKDHPSSLYSQTSTNWHINKAAPLSKSKILRLDIALSDRLKTDMCWNQCCNHKILDITFRSFTPSQHIT